MDREYILEKINSRDYQPLTEEAMAEAWGLLDIDKMILGSILEDLVKDGLIYRSKKEKYISMREKGFLTGTLSTNEKGFGFFKDLETREEYFIPHKSLKDAQDRDRVLVSVLSRTSGKNREARVEKVLERGTKSFIGEISVVRGKIQAVPIDPRQFGTYHYQGIKARKGDRVFCEILEYPEDHKWGLAEGVSLVGNLDDADMAIEQVIIKYGLAKDFPGSVLKAADKIPQEVSESELGGIRRDLRELLMVTIDGEDARDFDDAVSLERTAEGYRLGVHIADVSHYVSEGGTIDKEAWNRATSVYFPDRVLPMLPIALSNGICSLNHGVDRMAMTAMMNFDLQGKLTGYELHPSVIRVNKRMTYTNVSRILRRKEDPSVEADLWEYDALYEWFDLMAELADILTRKRARRGAIFFDFPELKIRVDEKGKPVELTKRVRNQAESIIEEFMLAANETVAEHLFWLEAPCIYRVHEEPPYEGVSTFNTMAAPYGFQLKADMDGKVHPRQYQDVLDKLEGHPVKELMETLLLRSMSHARYDIKALGHFGLSATYYCHFTSPIRRYPDLEVHRILKRYFMENLPEEKEKAAMNYRAFQAAEQSSEQEIAAESAERDVDKIKSVEYMKQFVGEAFEARISGMINSGLFVELDNLTEGFLPFFSLNGYHTFSPQEMVVRDAANQVRFRFGDRLRVRLVKADVLLGHLDFELEEGELLD